MVYSWVLFYTFLMKKITLLLALCLVFSACDRLPDAEENLDVPFTSQAPEQSWVEPWLNACEETSILMIDAYYSNEADGRDDEISIEEAKNGIKDIFKVKREEIDYSKDESMETVLELIENLDVNWKAKIVEDPSLEELLIELDARRPIIVPVFAPDLDSPHYEGGGPDYHVMVLTGYDLANSEFIVNDPGTQFGDELRFNFQVLMDAINDLNSADYDAGKKRVLFTEQR